MVVHRDLHYGWEFNERAACEAAIYGSFTADPKPMAADGQRFHCSLRSLDLGPAAGLLKTKARIARKHGSWIAIANAADKVLLDSRAGKKTLSTPALSPRKAVVHAQQHLVVDKHELEMESVAR